MTVQNQLHKQFGGCLMTIFIAVSSFAQQPLLSGTSVNINGKTIDTNMTYNSPLIDFNKGFDARQVVTDDAKIKVLKEEENSVLAVRLGHQAEYPSVVLPLSKDVDLANYIAIAMDITNHGEKQIAVEAQCLSKKDKTLTYADGTYFYYRSKIVLEAGETETMLIFLSRPMDNQPEYIKKHFKDMYGLPGGFLRRMLNLDLSQISHLGIFKQHTDDDWTITVDNIRALGKYSLPDERILENDFFPFIDQFGQYMHSDWIGKTKSVEDIYRQRIEEEQDIAKHPEPIAWNKYGGWANGPVVQATGHFRVEKYNGKWWFVDPEGKLFWSQGIDCVLLSQKTRISGREKYFSHIPVDNDFYFSNLMTKYKGSSTVVEDATNHVYKRLRSWGINTIAAWSSDHFYKEARTPYTIYINSGLPREFPDNLDAETFRESLRKILIEKYQIAQSATDPWCIGYFVDNECSWPETNQSEFIYTYFRVIRELLDELAPEKLYLGCRSNSVNFNRTAFEAAAKYCDVISINHYDYNFSDFRETVGLDRPLIVGEFHFGALDRGIPHTGLRTASNQKQRARLYKDFIDQALASDYIVGAHWFQYIDQLYTARGDGENYQIGFVDICDRPYSELIDASREIGSYMYEYRMNERLIANQKGLKK